MKSRTEDITFGQLRTFICAAQAGSFVRAADQLGVSQPAVSEQIAALEERLRCKLFLRRRGTTPLLTAEGARILDRAITIVNTGDELLGTLREKAEARTRIRLSIGPRLKDACLKPLLPKLFRDFPEIEVEVVPPLPLPDMVTALERGRVDLCVSAMGPDVRHWPHVQYACRVPTVMIAAPGTNRSLAEGRCRPEDLQYIFPGPYSRIGSWAEQALAELGSKPAKEPIFLEFADVVPEMVEQGQGVSIMMYETVADRISGGRIEVIDVPLEGMTRIIARSPWAPQKTRILENYIRTELEQMNQAELQGYLPVRKKISSGSLNRAGLVS